MKKQIFKLTSILLAMVMVFSLFSIIPISAEGVDKATAVSNLKAAWKNLTVKNAVEKLGVSYINTTWINDDNLETYQSDENPKALDPDVDETSISVGVSYSYQDMFWSNEVGKTMAYAYFSKAEKSQIRDIYFYYKSDVPVYGRPYVGYTDGSNASTSVKSSFSGQYVLPESNGEWVRVSYLDWMYGAAGTNTTNNWENRYASSVGMTDLLRVGFRLGTSAEGVEGTAIFSNMFTVYDENLLESESESNPWSDDEWIFNAFEVDADYYVADDAWSEFLEAREGVADFAPEICEPVLREAAEEMLVSENTYMRPVGIGRTPKAYVENAKDIDLYGDYTLTETIVGNADLNKAATAGLWLNELDLATQTANNRVGDANIRFGDYGENPYFMIRVNSIEGAASANIGFWGRFSGTPIGGGDKASNYKVNVVSGGEYKVYIDDILSDMNSGNDDYNAAYANWRNIFLQSLAATPGASASCQIFSVMTQDAGVKVNITVGSVVDTKNYKITSDKTGADFVAEMINLDISSFGNTEKFVAALEAAKKVFPNAEKLAAVENLRIAAGKMVKSVTPVFYPAGYFNGKRNNFTTVTNYATSDAEYLTYGPDLSPAYALTAQTARSLMGVWMTGASKNMDANLIRFDNANENAYFTIKVVSADAGATINITARLQTPKQNDETGYLVTIPNVEAGKEYKVTLKQILDGMTYSFKDFVTTANGGTNYYFNFMAVEASGANATVQVGTMISNNYYVPSNKTGEEFVTEMATLDISAYSNTEEFEEKLAYVLDNYYPEIKDLIEVGNTVRDLKNTWKSLKYIPQELNTAVFRGYQTGGSDASKTVFVDNDEASKEYLTSAEGVGTAYSFPVTDFTDAKGNSTPYEWFVWGNVGSNIFVKKDMESFGFWYKSSAQISKIRVIVGGNSYINNSDGVLPATDGWEFITVKELIGESYWNNFLSNAKYSNINDFRLMFTNSTARTSDLAFGEIVAYAPDFQIKGIDSWSNVELAINADKANLDIYEDDAELKSKFVALTAKLKETYAVNFMAHDVVNAAANLGDLGLKPVYTTKPWLGGEIAGGGIDEYLVGTSNNGDFTAFINTDKSGSVSCSPTSGSVIFEAKEPIALTEIDDIYFSYKIENWAGPATGARIWFYDERYTVFIKDEEGNIIVDEEDNKSISRGYWDCEMATYGNSRYFEVAGDTDGWATTSLATIFGSDWKTVYIQYLKGELGKYGNNATDAEGNPYAGTITMDNTYITKLSLGFNGADIEGDNADVTLGSMYLDYADDRFAIDANVADPEAVLAEALAFDVSNCKKADADAFKKAVAALAEKLGREDEVSNENCVAGNKTANLVDLSLLSRYVDAVEAGEVKVKEFLEDNYIDLQAANIVGEDDVVDVDDLIALRKRLLGVPEIQ